MRANEFIAEGYPAYPPEIIEQVKKLFDKGFSRKDIANELGIAENQVGNILNNHYKERELKRLDFTPAQIALVKQLFDQGLSFDNISAKSNLSIQRIEDLLKHHYKDRQKRVLRNPAATSDDKNRMAKMYSDGTSLGTIGKEFNISKQGVIHHLKRFPDYDELKQKHESNRDISDNQVTTKIHRAGEIGNLRHQGPNSKGRRGTTYKNYF